ncbi:hypothetical protein BC628DRAFT_1078834 [Trametes gibbosa]|nr:hypothetical protein BC628DRAFT_1078834 [Trametes gibbosa]
MVLLLPVQEVASTIFDITGVWMKRLIEDRFSGLSRPALRGCIFTCVTLHRWNARGRAKHRYTQAFSAREAAPRETHVYSNPRSGLGDDVRRMNTRDRPRAWKHRRQFLRPVSTVTLTADLTVSQSGESATLQSGHHTRTWGRRSQRPKLGTTFINHIPRPLSAIPPRLRFNLRWRICTDTNMRTSCEGHPP